jgi:ferritin
MDKKLVNEINKQITYEFYSEFLYLSMAAYASEHDLPGFENWYITQAAEEHFHATKFVNYLHARDEKAIITGFENPPVEFNSLLDTFEQSLDHEKIVTGRINLLMSIAHEVHDYAAISFLNWYVDEQVEEEESFTNMIGQIKLVGGAGPGLYYLDKEAGARTFTQPAADGTAQ